MPYSIIIADDHDVVRQGIKSVIQNDESYRVVAETTDGEMTVRKVEEKKPDILLLDISMPKGGGLDIIKKINWFSPETKVVIITVHKSDYYLIDAIKKGVKGYLHKSEVVKELIPALKKVIRDKIYISSSLSSIFSQKSLWDEKKIKSRQITPREIEVMRLIAQGKTSKEIAEILYISPRTADNHRQNIFGKLGIHKNTNLIKFIIESGIVDIE